MRRAPILTTALFAASMVLSAGTASAQNAGASAAEARGLRYLSWSSRGEVDPAAQSPVTPAAASPLRRDLRRPNTVIPHGGFAAASPAPARRGLTPAPGSGRTLTPANAWMNRIAPPPEPAMPEPPPAPVVAPVRATPDYLPDPGGRGQAVPAALVQPPAPVAQQAPVLSDPSDPMAPRRDAPVFRMHQEGPIPAEPAVQPIAAPVEAAVRPPQPRRVAEVTNTGERPLRQGGRYYSVHRQVGRQPDALEIPEPTYIDALAVTIPETMASQDLAAPEQGPTLIRDAQGHVRTAPAASDGDHQ